MTRIVGFLAGGWAWLVSLVNTWLVAWGTSAAAAPGDWTETVVTIMRTCTAMLACATLLFLLFAWPPLLGVACGASAVVVILTWGICLGRFHGLSEIIYGLVVTILSLPGTAGLAGLWADGRASPPDHWGRPTWLA